jgi:hypothetical protein
VKIMMNDELTTTGRQKGRLIRTRDARQMLDIGDSAMRALMASGYGPPGFKRPGSTHWLFWSGEVLDYLESNRRRPAA